MATNDRIILGEILAQNREALAPNLNESQYFELFTSEQLLKDYDLSYDELESGLIGDGGDGGIDGFYLFVDGELATDDFDYDSVRRHAELRVFLTQAKRSASFRETAVERFLTVSRDIFDLTRSISSALTIYNTGLLSSIERFRTAQQELASRFPELRVDFNYASRGSQVSDPVRRKADQVVDLVRSLFPSSQPKFHFIGASDLLELARRQPQTVYSLRLAESPISSEDQVGFICLVRLEDYCHFISDDSGNLRRGLFDANVRDYQGKTEVNDEIQESLRDEASREDFWWLNNGVTILATRASQSGKTLTIENPQVVNGLQTSTEIFRYFESSNTSDEKRTVLVRVIVPVEGASRDRIIKATNRQTTVQLASLRATDRVHRDIEEFLRPRGLFYDRRKNFYKNAGKPRDRIVSIPYLGQSVMAILLGRPDTARARPSSLLKKDEDYRRVFSTDYPIQVYYVCASILQSVESVLRTQDPPLEAKDRNNLRFYVAMQVVRDELGTLKPTADQIAQMDPGNIDESRISSALEVVKSDYEVLGGDDQVAKGTTLLERLQTG